MILQKSLLTILAPEFLKGRVHINKRTFNWGDRLQPLDSAGELGCPLEWKGLSGDGVDGVAGEDSSNFRV